MDGLVLVNFELHEEIGEECDATQSASLMLYAGVPTAELQSMLAAVFGITQASSIAAIQVQPDGHIVPLSYLSARPDAFASVDKYQTLQLMIVRSPMDTLLAHRPDSSHASTSAKQASTVGDLIPGSRPSLQIQTVDLAGAGSARDALFELLVSLTAPPVPLVNAAEQIALRARIESDDREVNQWYNEYRADGDMLALVRRLIAAANNDLNSMPPPSLELTLARIWILKEMSLLTQEECLALQDLARDQDSLIATVFIIYGGADVDEGVLASKLLDAINKNQVVESDSERDRQRLLQFRLQIVRDLNDAELLDDAEAEFVEAAIASHRPFIEDAFPEFAVSGDSGRLARAITGELNSNEVGGDSDRIQSTDWLLSRLADTHGLSDHWVRSLKALIGNRDEVALAAIDLFNQDCDWNELIDTLDRLLAYRAGEQKTAAGRTPLNAVNNGTVRMLSSSERRHLCQLADDLLKENLVDDSHWASLKALILRKDPVIEAAYSLYSNVNDWNEFADTSLRLACRSHQGPAHVADTVSYTDVLYALVASGAVPADGARRIVQAADAQDDTVAGVVGQYQADGNRTKLSENLIQLAKSI
ncbi:Uncharacterized protein PBTT_02096 [Plasmodiophora brassicae]